jgi:tetratricopeptide (TPR) repeat protein
MRMITFRLAAIGTISLITVGASPSIVSARLSIDPATINIPPAEPTNKIEPRTARDFFNRGNARKKAKDYPGAIADYTRSIELNPRAFGAYINRGNARQSVRDYNGSIDDYSTAIQLNPNLARAYYNRAISYRKLGLIQYSIVDLQQAAKLFEVQGETANAQSAMNAVRKLELNSTKEQP